MSQKTKTSVPKTSQPLRDPCIKRLARKGGIKRLSGETYAEMRKNLDTFLRKIVKDAVITTDHAKRRTVNSSDVLYALSQNSHKMYL